MSSFSPSDAGRRLKWTLPGPLTSAISVLVNARATNGPSEPYFRQRASGGTWHPVSEEAISDPPQASITVKVSELDTWDQQWKEYHEHADPDDQGCVFGPSDDDGPGELLECCGEQQPQAPQPLVVNASAKEYVTVHDYVSTVHAWLMEHFDDISSAVNMWDDGEAPAGQKLVVIHWELRNLSIMDENIRQQIGQYQLAPHPGPLPSHCPQPRSERMRPDEIKRLNEQLRREGSNVQYDEN